MKYKDLIDQLTLKEKAALLGIRATEDYFRRIGAPVTIRELGVEADDRTLMDIASLITANGTATVGGVVPMTREDVFAVYKSANR